MSLKLPLFKINDLINSLKNKKSQINVIDHTFSAKLHLIVNVVLSPERVFQT